MKKIIYILHLEDSEADAMLIHETINSELAFCKIKRVETKSAFSDALKNEIFDLIISDFALPSFNGLEALSMAKELAPDVPYIYVSGHIGEDRAIEALKMGATDYVLKDKLAKLIPAIYRALHELEEKAKRKAAEEALREAGRFTRSTLNSQIFQLGVIEENGKILFVNTKWIDKAVLSSPIPQGLKEGENYLEKCRENSESIKFATGIMSVLNGYAREYGQEYQCLLPDGNKWYVSIVNKFEGEGPVRLIIVHVDITERKLAEEKIKIYNTQLETAIAVKQRILSSSFDIENIMNLIVENAQAITHADGSTIGFVESEEIKFKASSGLFKKYGEIKLNINSSLAGYCYRTGEITICQDTEIDERVDKISARKMGIRSIMIFPLLHNNVTVGILNIVYKLPNSITDANISLMKLLVVFLASSMSLAEKFESNNNLAEEKSTALERLSESEKRFRDLAELLPQTIFEANTKMEITYINKTGIETFQFTQDDLDRGILVEHILNEKDKAFIFEKFHQVLSGARFGGVEINVLRKDKTEFPCIVYANPIYKDNVPVGIRGILIDMTERKKSIELLEESEKRYRTLFEKNLAGVFITTLEGKVISCNQAFANIYGYKSIDEVIVSDAYTFYPNKETRDLFIRKLIKEKELKNYETKGRKITGEEIWILENAELEYGDDNKTAYIFGTILDITERKDIEQEILNAKEKAEEMNRLKSSFLANMSHELRTPLIGILGFSQILSAEIKNDELRDMAETIYNSGGRLLETLNLILDLSRIEADRLDIVYSEFDAIECIKGIIKLSKSIADKKGLFLKLDSKFNSFNIRLDKRLYTEIVENLISNAVKFTGKGGVTVLAEEELINGKKWIVIKVADTGIGIPRESLDIIFEEFRQASEGYARNFEGTGLGLTITRKFVDKLKGSISVESEVGKGSTFIVKLPGNINSTKAGLQREDYSIDGGVKNRAQKNKPSILVVEDDEVAMSITKIYLKKEYIMSGTNSGTEAVELCRSNEFDAILMDINLGSRMSGLDAVNEIRKLPAYKSTPIIAFTAYAMQGEKEKFISAGCTHYISKPFTREQLYAVLKEALA